MAEIDTYLAELLRAHNIRATPPVDLDALAAALGLLVRRDANGGAAGTIGLYEGKPVIRIDASASRARYRFTCAHEIGHFLLARDVGPIETIWRGQPSLRQPERFCDRFAESLLMPADWVTSVAGGPQSLERLAWIARTAEVSMSAASVRLTRMARWRRTLLRVARLSRSWSLMSVTGLLRPGWRTGLELPPGFDRRLLAAVSDAHGAHRWLPLVLNGTPCYALAEARMHNDRAIAWVDLIDRRAVNVPRRVQRGAAQDFPVA